MIRKPVFAVAVVLLAATGAASLDAKIAQDCGPTYNPVISVPAPDEPYGNPAAPGFYSFNVCLNGVKDIHTGTSCAKNTGFYISSNSSDSHFSIYDDYNLHVCTGTMTTRIQDSCFDNQTALFSVSSATNGHVAEPGFYDKELCGFFSPPVNVSLTLTANISGGDETRFDGEKINEGKFYLADLPYFSASSGDYLTGVIARDFRNAEYSLINKNRYTVTTRKNDASFLVPFTSAGYRDIEEKSQDIKDGVFLEEIDPSFGFIQPRKNTVRVALESDKNVNSEFKVSPGTYVFKMKKTGQNSIDMVLK